MTMNEHNNAFSNVSSSLPLPLPLPLPLTNYEPNKIFQITKIKNRKKWTDEDDALLIHLANKYKEKHWKEISKHFANKNSLQCFSRYKRVRPGIVKGAWTKEEDEQILQLVHEYGQSWSKIAKIVNSRNGKQIRDRYINALDPMIKKGKFSDDEDRLLIKLYIATGPKWSLISKSFPDRTADMVKNRFHSSIKKIFFTQEAITRKTKLMQKLKEKKILAMNETYYSVLPLTINDSNNNSNNSTNTISNHICFTLENNKKNKRKESNSENNSNKSLCQLVIDPIITIDPSINNNCNSSIDDIDFFSLLSNENNNNNDDSISNNNNEFFNLN